MQLSFSRWTKFVVLVFANHFRRNCILVLEWNTHQIIMNSPINWINSPRRLISQLISIRTSRLLPNNLMIRKIALDVLNDELLALLIRLVLISSLWEDRASMILDPDRRAPCCATYSMLLISSISGVWTSGIRRWGGGGWVVCVCAVCGCRQKIFVHASAPFSTRVETHVVYPTTTTPTPHKNLHIMYYLNFTSLCALRRLNDFPESRRWSPWLE